MESIPNNTVADRQTDRQTDNDTLLIPSCQDLQCKTARPVEQTVDLEKFAESVNIKEHWRTAMLMGNIPDRRDGKRSRYDCSRYKFFLDAPFDISSECCKVMKKAPTHQYAKETGRHPMTGQMAEESQLRTQQWIKNGCNGFQMKAPISNPMSFWREQDVLQYIATRHIPICSVYGDIVATDRDGMPYDVVTLVGSGMDLSDYKLMTTGCDRTGCLFCAYGAHREKPGQGRFERLKVTHPKLYDYIMRDESEGGLGYKWKIDWVNEHNGKGTIIRY